MSERTSAEAIRAGDHAALEALSRSVLVVCPDNLVARPWGGARLPELKGLPPSQPGDPPIGEAFEISAYQEDGEAGAHPSVVRFEDGSELQLPAVLHAAGEAILGETLYRRYGPGLPLLPKTLHIRQLLSVQAHPPGQPEAYVILDAAPGATLRLGFRETVDAQALSQRLATGRRQQRTLRDLVTVDEITLGAALAPLFAARALDAAAVTLALAPLLKNQADVPGVTALVGSLHGLCWDVLDLLNEISVQTGDVLFNAAPGVDDSSRLDAAVHALGNPEQREMVLLEVRRPGITLRAWDHARFPMRAVAVDEALDAMQINPSDPDGYRAVPRGVAPGVLRSIDCSLFVVDHIRHIRGGQPVAQRSAGSPRTLHAVTSALRVLRPDGTLMARLPRGTSALLPASLGAYDLVLEDPAGEAIQVTVPPTA